LDPYKPASLQEGKIAGRLSRQIRRPAPQGARTRPVKQQTGKRGSSHWRVVVQP